MKSFVSATNTLGFLGPLALGLCAVSARAGDSPAAPVAVDPTQTVVEEFLIPSADAGIDLYVRNRHQPGERMLRFRRHVHHR